MKNTGLSLLVAGLVCVSAHAGIRYQLPSPIYLGGGINENSVSGWGSTTGFQVFGGYNFGRINRAPNTPISLALEVGYMNTGDFQRTVYPPFGQVISSERFQGLWTTGVLSLPINSRVDLLARLGLDLGDDSGAMGGIGAGINLNRQTQLRFEYVARPTVDSLQINVVFYPDQ